MPLEENSQSMNQMILSKRRENARRIKENYNSTLSKYESAKEILENASLNLKSLEEHASILDHKSFLYSGEISDLSSKILECQQRLINLESNMVTLDIKLAHTEMIKEKEIKTFELRQNVMNEKAKENEEFWKNEIKGNLMVLEDKLNGLRRKRESLEKQVDAMSGKIKEKDTAKLSEDCMILKKRNAAIHKRLIKRVEALEKQLKEHRNNQN